ncbi:MAG: LEVG family PEP-CTERM protein [Leptolyngbyaceae cyanobacterium]
MNGKFLSLLGSVAAVGMVVTPAAAFDFTPQETGEVDVGLGCLETCLTLDPIFGSIESLIDSSTGEKSRLFVDYFGDGDVVETYDNGNIEFKTRDAGTNSLGYWFRPSEVNEEKGQLEVGTYLLTFEKTFAELTVEFFDTEYTGETGVMAINGDDGNPNYVAKGPDGNIVRQTYQNVDSIELALGYDKPNGTGDGVNFRIYGTPVAVPEPASVLGLLAVAGIGVASRRKLAQPAEAA